MTVGTVRHRQISIELDDIAQELVYHDEQMTKLYARRLALWQEGQSLDPKMTHAVLGAASATTEGAVTQALRKRRKREQG